MKGILFIKILYLFVIFLFLVNTTNANYFINVRVPLEYLSINPGDSISANVKIVRISGEAERNDYNIKARIIDSYNNILIEKNEVIAIEKEVDIIVSFDIPKNMNPGEYKIEVVVGDSKSSAGFIVEDVSKIGIYLIYITVVILLLFIVAFYYYNRKLNKLIKHIKKVSIKNLIKRR